MLKAGGPLRRIAPMSSGANEKSVLVTGTRGHIGSEVCRTLRAAQVRLVPVDLEPDGSQGVIACDLRSKSDVLRLFQTHSIRTVIHVAGILPTAFQADPLAAAEVNLGGSFELLRQAVAAGVKRFVFASSMSVYGSLPTERPLNEKDPAIPDEPYGASKRAVELIGETLAKKGTIEFVSLRIARVIGLGIRKTASPWRSQIFESSPQAGSVLIPYSPEVALSLVHVEDVARMLAILAETAHMMSFVYNSAAETWDVKRLKDVIEEIRGIPVEVGQVGVLAGPTCDGDAFAREFGFELVGLRRRLLDLKLSAN
jgi:nucleoside-diphosphate-sugar epimerase